VSASGELCWAGAGAHPARGRIAARRPRSQPEHLDPTQSPVPQAGAGDCWGARNGRDEHRPLAPGVMWEVAIDGERGTRRRAGRDSPAVFAPARRQLVSTRGVPPTWWVLAPHTLATSEGAAWVAGAKRLAIQAAPTSPPQPDPPLPQVMPGFGVLDWGSGHPPTCGAPGGVLGRGSLGVLVLPHPGAPELGSPERSTRRRSGGARWGVPLPPMSPTDWGPAPRVLLSLTRQPSSARRVQGTTGGTTITPSGRRLGCVRRAAEELRVTNVCRDRRRLVDCLAHQTLGASGRPAWRSWRFGSPPDSHAE
jgi:hypothetical protein